MDNITEIKEMADKVMSGRLYDFIEHETNNLRCAVKITEDDCLVIMTFGEKNVITCVSKYLAHPRIIFECKVIRSIDWVVCDREIQYSILYKDWAGEDQCYVISLQKQVQREDDDYSM